MNEKVYASIFPIDLHWRNHGLKGAAFCVYGLGLTTRNRTRSGLLRQHCTHTRKTADFIANRNCIMQQPWYRPLWQNLWQNRQNSVVTSAPRKDNKTPFLPSPNLIFPPRLQPGKVWPWYVFLLFLARNRPQTFLQLSVAGGKRYARTHPKKIVLSFNSGLGRRKRENVDDPPFVFDCHGSSEKKKEKKGNWGRKCSVMMVLRNREPGLLQNHPRCCNRRIFCVHACVLTVRSSCVGGSLWVIDFTAA